MKLQSDYSWIRGVNHHIEPEETLRRHLGYGSRVGLNAVRIWLSRGAFEKDGERYVKSVVDFVRVCHDCGYKTMPILYNGNGRPLSEIETRDFWSRDEAFANAIVPALRDEPGLLMWDVMNEPTCNPHVMGNPDKDEKARREELTWEFVRHFCGYVRKLDQENAITVGYTTAFEAEPTIESVDVLSFHDYSGTRASIERNYALADELGRKYGKPVIQTETGCLARCNPYDLALETCQRHNIGWFVFNLMIQGRCDSEHGVFYDDGTVRDPATIAAMIGCFRCRDTEAIVLPVMNREGAADRCVSNIKKALTEYTCDAFDYRPSDVSSLLDAAEEAANLLECCDMTPMALPPTAQILRWRKMISSGEKVKLSEVREFAYGIALSLRDQCQLL